MRPAVSAAPKPNPPRQIRVATLTFSDTRGKHDDASGQLLDELLGAAGFYVVSHAVVREDRETIRAAMAALCARADIDAVITTGGTGLAPRDGTVEAVVPLLDKRLDGFGEAFRRLSWDEIGPNAVLSRALAGTAGRTVVACLPGSRKAVRLGVEALLVPTLRHAVELARGERVAHEHDGRDGGSAATPTPGQEGP
ncbi:MAG: MogA/MoaB family molybdenum cofactor biosynthesis protein [Deltaproteobacteria bacterium]|nr:MogA/MoaB family molybdenum cofactor biosynthesis protein [Deltaproteobacteria bacterium]